MKGNRVISFMLGLLMWFGCGRSVFASYIFYDNFQQGVLDNAVWTTIYTNNEGSISFDSDGIMINSVDEHVPFIYSNSILANNGDYVIKIKFKYENVNINGQGIGVGFMNNFNTNVQQIGLWQDSHDGMVAYYNRSFSEMGCANINNSRDEAGIRQYFSLGNYGPTDWHVFEVEKVGSEYKLFVDRITNPLPIFSYQQIFCFPNRIFFGNLQPGSRFSWSPLRINYISVEDVTGQLTTPTPQSTVEPTVEPTLAPSPSPTMVPTEVPTAVPTQVPTAVPTQIPTPVPRKEKIIVIPGLGASWNTTAVVANIDLPNNQWRLLPFVHNYDGLMETLKLNGFSDSGSNQNLFLWPYDWRDRISNISEELNSFIEENVGDDEKVNLLGHSLGGLVARDWAQKHFGDERLGKVVTMGSPFEGTVKGYEMWASGEVPTDWGWKAVALNVLLQTQKQYFPTVTALVRSAVPSLKDINPIFNFLRKKTGTVNWQNTSGANEYLDQMKKGNIFNNQTLETVVARGVITKRIILAEDQSWVDKALMRWPDGKPVSYLMDDGDGTVLASSASLSGALVENIDAKHGDMVDPSIPKIFEFLDIPLEHRVNSPPDSIDGNLVYFIGSPAYIEVRCEGKPPVISDSSGFVVISDWKGKNCYPVVVGTENGIYHLAYGVAGDNASWQYSEGEIIAEKMVDFSKLSTSYELIIRDIKLLQTRYKNNYWLKLAIMMSQRQQPELLLEAVFGFRKFTNEYQISDRILESIEDVLAKKYENSSHGLAKTLLKVSESNMERLNKYVEKHKKFSVFEANSKIKFDTGVKSLRGLYNEDEYGLVNARQMILLGTMLEVY